MDVLNALLLSVSVLSFLVFVAFFGRLPALRYGFFHDDEYIRRRKKEYQ